MSGDGEITDLMMELQRARNKVKNMQKLANFPKDVRQWPAHKEAIKAQKAVVARLVYNRTLEKIRSES